jgi:hypothetical protein
MLTGVTLYYLLSSSQEAVRCLHVSIKTISLKQRTGHDTQNAGLPGFETNHLASTQRLSVKIEHITLRQNLTTTFRLYCRRFKDVKMGAPQCLFDMQLTWRAIQPQTP